MKTFIIISLIIHIIILVILTFKKNLNSNEKLESEYHIEVRQYASRGWYHIVFTNNNWKTTEELLNQKDYGPLLFWSVNGSKEAAIEFAKEMDSYEKARNWNEPGYKAAKTTKIY